ncbi:MAG TPA: MFS transporter [Candidatus Limnocylindria bacterium]|nr:MFS transporter [Candidatus Limnocylindria bacterium]
MWNGLGSIVLPKRAEALFGPAWAGLGLDLITVLGVVAALLVQPTVGAISDFTASRFGRRKPYIIVGSLLSLVFLAAVAWADAPFTIIVALVLLQGASNIAQGPFQGYVPDLVPSRQVGVASGLMGVMTIVGGVAGVAICLSGYQQLQAGMDDAQVRSLLFLPTLGLGVIQAVTMVVMALTVDEGRAALPREGRSWWQLARSAWDTDILRERSFVWLLVSRLCFLAMVGVIGAFAVFLLERTFGLAPSEAQSYLLTIGLIIAGSTLIVAIPAARLSDRVGRKRVINIAFVLGAIGVAGVSIAPTVPLAMLALVPLGLSGGAFLVVDWALMTDIIPKARTGRYMGISNVATASAGPIGLALGGAILLLVTIAGKTSPAAPDMESTLYGLAPRVAFASMLLFIAIAAWALRRVDETRRED